VRGASRWNGVGDAGVGKSRLCSEFVERCRARGLAVNEGHGMAHGKNIPFMPILQAMRGYFRIARGDDDRTARELIEETGARVCEPLLHERRAELARLDGDEAARADELREAARLYTEMGATGRAQRVAAELSS
jgi:adenylate cyclase